MLIMVILQQGQRWTCGKDWRDEKLVFVLLGAVLLGIAFSTLKWPSSLCAE
jgi:hypothetical protein